MTKTRQRGKKFEILGKPQFNEFPFISHNKSLFSGESHSQSYNFRDFLLSAYTCAVFL